MISHSYSRLAMFEQCEAKYDYVYHSKRVKDPGNVHTDYGSRVHEKLETLGRSWPEAVLGDLPNDPEIAPFVPAVLKILEQPGDKYFEHQMALRRDKTPCDWFAQDVWLRGIADVLVIDDKRAVAIDWKTGKIRDNPTQLMLFAAIILESFKQVDSVKAAFVWLMHNETTKFTYHRKMLQGMWYELETRFKRVEQAAELGVFKTKPSGLCPWCPAKDICPDARRR